MRSGCYNIAMSIDPIHCIHTKIGSTTTQNRAPITHHYRRTSDPVRHCPLYPKHHPSRECRKNPTADVWQVNNTLSCLRGVEWIPRDVHR